MKHTFRILFLLFFIFSPQAYARVLNYNQVQVVKREMPTAVLVDVRSTKQFDGEMIPGSKRIAEDRITEEALLAAVGSKSTPIIFYCSSASSPESGRVMDKARSWGFMNIFRYGGGMADYKLRMGGNP